MTMKTILGLVTTTILFNAQAAQAKTEVEWWHAMGGFWGKK